MPNCLSDSQYLELLNYTCSVHRAYFEKGLMKHGDLKCPNCNESMFDTQDFEQHQKWCEVKNQMNPICKICNDEMIEYMGRVFCPIHNVGCENKDGVEYP